MGWLFQAIPKRYNLARIEPKATETWLVTRYGDEMRRGDLVFLWMAGASETRGLYGWGRIAEDAPRYYKNWGYGIDVRYEQRFARHIPHDEVRALPSLADFILFRVAIGTNFKLDERQTGEISALIRRKLGAEAAP